MTTSEIRGALRRRWYLSLTVLIAAVGVAYMIHSGASKNLTGTATVQILVDSPSSSLVNVDANSAGLAAQAGVLAQAMTSNAVLTSISHTARVPAAEVTAEGPYSGAADVLDVPTPSEARGMQLGAITPKFHLSFLAQQTLPIITVTATGPNPESAGRLADAILPGTQAWLGTIAAQDQLNTKHRIVLRQLGDAEAAYMNSSAAKELAAVGAIAIILIGFLAVVLFDRFGPRRTHRMLGELEHAFGFDSEGAGLPSGHGLPSSEEGSLSLNGQASPYVADSRLITGRRAAVAGSLLNGGSPSTDSSDH